MVAGEGRHTETGEDRHKTGEDRHTETGEDRRMETSMGWAEEGLGAGGIEGDGLGRTKAAAAAAAAAGDCAVGVADDDVGRDTLLGCVDQKVKESILSNMILLSHHVTFISLHFDYRCASDTFGSITQVSEFVEKQPSPSSE